MNKIEIMGDEKTCTVCNRAFTHRRVLSPSSIEGLYNVELIFNCARCRNLLRRKGSLRDKILEIEWLLFGLSNIPHYFEE